jgi:hypothetical protein
MANAEFLLLTPVSVAFEVRRPDTNNDNNEAELVRTQYKARVRPITLLFPHDTNIGTTPVRRNVPITTKRPAHANGQAMPGRDVVAKSLQDLSKYYFAAVGSGAGLSERLRR